MDSDSYAEHAV